MATVQISPCLQEIICGLSAATLSVLRGVLETQLAAVQAQVAIIAGKLVVVDIIVAPVVLVKDAAETALNDIRALANVIPINLIGDCVQLGQFSAALNTNIDLISADLEDQVRDITRILSVKKELQFIQDQLNALIDQINAVLTVISLCS